MLSPYNKEIYPNIRGRSFTIYDSTLRDGEQMPGVSFSKVQKMEIAELLSGIGVPQIEAGFPAVSEAEKAAVKSIAKMQTGSEILALSRLNKGDIDAAIDCDVGMVMIFVASSDIHLEHKLRKSRTEIASATEEALAYARSHGIKYSFSTEDSTRTSPEYLLRLCALGKCMGAARIGITDTTGCILPPAMENLTKMMLAEIEPPLSLHLHDDFGLALANALAGANAGATDFAVTVNGIGERAGNLALEKLVAALEFGCGAKTGIDTTGLTKLSRRVSEIAGLPVSRNRPWTGENVFMHESGIHAAAIMANPATYECVAPGLVGAKRNILLGKHSGRTVIKRLLADMGREATEEQMTAIRDRVKRRGEANGSVSRQEFESIVNNIVDDK